MDTPYFNPIMDTENNDLEKVVERYNKTISFYEDKKFEYEDDDYIEDNYGWEKIKSVDVIHDRLIETAKRSLMRFDPKLVSRVDGTRRWIYPRLDDIKCPELFEAIKDLSTHNFLNEIMISCEGIVDEDSNPPIFNKKTINTTCHEFFNSKSEILDFLRRKRKTHHIFFRTIKMDRSEPVLSPYTKDNYCLCLYVCER